MMRTFLLVLLAVLVFIGIVVARLPASWAMPDPKTGVVCGDVDGTVWNGTCTGLVFQQQPVGDLTWDIHAARLLAGKLNADVALTRPAGSARGTVEVGMDRKVIARNVQADLPLDREWVSQFLPPNLSGLRGKVHAELGLLRFDTRGVQAIEGSIRVQDLTDGTGSDAQKWGSYSLTFPPAGGGIPVGQLRDLGGGPLSVEGSLKLTPEPGYDLEGLVAARPDAPRDLADNLRFLGSPDSQGRRPFSLSGTF